MLLTLFNKTKNNYKLADDDIQVFMGVMSGEKKLEFDNGEDAMLMKNYLRLLCADIARERDRVGGDWALASAVPALLDRQWRRHIRWSVTHHHYFL